MTPASACFVSMPIFWQQVQQLAFIWHYQIICLFKSINQSKISKMHTRLIHKKKQTHLHSLTYQELEQKLAEVTRKLKLVCQSYCSLKHLIKSKDLQIMKLKEQVIRVTQIHEMKDYDRIKEIKKKYQIEDKRASMIGRVEADVSEGRGLRHIKSMSPHQFKSLQNSKVVSSNLKQLSPSLVQPLHQVHKHKSSTFSFSNQNPVPSEVSIVEGKNAINRRNDIIEIDNKYNQDLEQVYKDKPASNFKENYQEAIRNQQKCAPKLNDQLTHQNKLHKQARLKDRLLDVERHEPEAEILKELWQERDRQIKRMDDLFENLNRKIYGI